MADVIAGPWTGPPVEQPTPSRVGLPDDWWRRDDHGQLWVWCSPAFKAAPRWCPSPVPMAKVTKGIPARSPNRDRITVALDLRMMHGPEVDEALGVLDALDTVVDSWEDGTAVPSEEDVRRLATLTGFAPEWFYQGTLPQLEGAWLCGTDGCRRAE